MKGTALFVFSILLSAALAAQSIPFSSRCTEKAVGSLEDVAAAILADSLNPMTHYGAGDAVLYAVPAFFLADRIMKDPAIEGDGLRGASFGFGGGAALTDEVMVFLIAAGMKMRGNLEYEAFGSGTGIVQSEVELSLLSIQGGAGYDVFRTDCLSIPLYAGVSLQYFSVDLVSGPVSWAGNAVTADVSGGGFLFGLYCGGAVSLKILNKFMITPYYMYLLDLNGPNLEARLRGLPAADRRDLAVDPVSAGLLGFNVGLKSDSRFSFSVSAGSMLSSLLGFGSKVSSNGVEMRSIVCIFSYKTK